ncbi:hypothetical protein DL95DRAFT_447211 [Leptodontidium sp. 2 PMI_412]|nr:hypothetical protein BKA61DRAFT_681337 [Leptodontidium sp. MPI-SDFR-AT-0119]KAH9213166.1 hypothetical protein DL95DRAFT_447211 [Leptodontidium sp. 2 PMI_412]
MLFNTLYIFGLVAIASAAPRLHSRFEKEVGAPAARGLQWTPRSITPRSKNYVTNFVSGFDSTVIIQQQTITILQLSNAQALAEQQRQAELLLVQAIQQQLIAQQQLQFAIDNIRINTFLNVNPSVNTVAVILTQVNDNRDQNNRNTRYFTRQIQSNPSASEQVFVLINEVSQMNIGDFDVAGTPTAEAAASPSGTASAASFAAPQFGSYTPGGNISLQAQGINLYPFGVAAPSFGNSRSFIDPALIIQPRQQLFVTNQNQNQFNVVIIA